MIPVVDVSQHQGTIDFRVMRARAVQGVILRITHGLTLDTRAEEFYEAALQAGYPEHEIGWYTFINPKRSTAEDAASYAVMHMERITQGSPSFLMLDIESFHEESPNRGSCGGWVGQRFAGWLRTFMTRCRVEAPTVPLVGYTNTAFWDSDGGVGHDHRGVPHVGDTDLAGQLDWIVPRYPAYSLAAYARNPLPSLPAGWEAWAAARGVEPLPPRGARGWAGWQFSAGYNRQGARYGATSLDLDLNLVNPTAWARWTGAVPQPVDPPDHSTPDPAPAPIITLEDDMPAALISVRDDPAVFVTDGLTARSARKGETVVRMQRAGVWAPVIEEVEREDLLALRFEGPLPDYSTVDPEVAASKPGRTRREDFGSFSD